MVTFKEIKKISLVFFLGSAGAPIVYIVSGIIHPRGFHFFPKYNFVAIIFPFVVVWTVSLVCTTIIAGVLWKYIHKYKLDGVLSYMFIAIVASSTLSLFTSHNIPLLGIGMSAANAVMIRLFEVSVFNLHNDVTSKGGRGPQ